MSKSSTPARTRKRTKPSKPSPNFPLTVNGNGQFSKVIRGRTYYFGPWGDPQTALAEYLRVKDYLLAGKTPPPKAAIRTVKDVFNFYLARQEERFQDGEITQRTFIDCKEECTFVVSHIGQLSAEDIGPMDFGYLRGKFKRTWGVRMRERYIRRVRTVFNFALEEEHVSRLPSFGSRFKLPGKKEWKRERALRGNRGDEVFSASQLRTVLKHLEGKGKFLQLRAMVLLGINVGYGNADCGRLKAADIQDEWIRLYRIKTGEDRDCPLWPETLEAIQQVLNTRKKPHSEGFVFVTKYGNSWHKESGKSPISQSFRRVTKELGINPTFYALRHTFQTECDRCNVPPHVTRAIMGHADGSMSGHNSHGVKDDQLRAAVDKVRAWLFPGNAVATR